MPRTRVSIGDWPRLTRFYGIPPSELAVLPNNILEVYARQLEEIEAEEVLNAILASDMPHAEEKDRRRIFRQLERVASSTPSEPTKIDPRTAAGRATAASLGIGIKLPTIDSE